VLLAPLLATSLGLGSVGASTSLPHPVSSTVLSAELTAAATANLPNPSTDVLPAGVDTAPPYAEASVRAMAHTDCQQTTPAVLPVPSASTCVYGDPTATRTLVLFGDSNAYMWLPAIDRFGANDQWRVVAYTHPLCQPEATPWLKGSEVLWASVVIPVGVGQEGRVSTSTQRTITSSLEALVTELEAMGSKTVLLQPIPRFDPQFGFPTDYDPNECATIHPSSLAGCEVTPAQSASLSEARAVASTGTADHVPVIATVGLFCTATRCPLFVSTSSGTLLLYLNSSHATRAFTAYVSTALAGGLAHSV
jgi:hypothetical protein